MLGDILHIFSEMGLKEGFWRLKGGLRKRCLRVALPTMKEPRRDTIFYDTSY